MCLCICVNACVGPCVCMHVCMCVCLCGCMCVWVRGLIVSVLLIHSFTHSNSLISPSIHRQTKLRWYPFHTQVLSIQWKEENEVPDNKMDLSAKKFVLSEIQLDQIKSNIDHYVISWNHSIFNEYENYLKLYYIFFVFKYFGLTWNFIKFVKTILKDFIAIDFCWSDVHLEYRPCRASGKKEGIFFSYIVFVFGYFGLTWNFIKFVKTILEDFIAIDFCWSNVRLEYNQSWG